MKVAQTVPFLTLAYWASTPLFLRGLKDFEIFWGSRGIRVCQKLGRGTNLRIGEIMSYRGVH